MTVGDYGQQFQINVTSALDLTTADSISVTVRKPDGTQASWSPLVIAKASITYVLELGDLDQPGTYCGDVTVSWGNLVDPPGRATSSIFSFQVVPIL